MQHFIGESFDAAISGMNNAGFFVTLENSGAEGLVPITSLKGEAFTFDGSKQQMSNQQHTYHIGDHVSVVLKSVDLRSRKMCFATT